MHVATAEDIPAIMGHAEKFFAKDDVLGPIYDAAFFREWLAAAVATPEQVLIVMGETGSACLEFGQDFRNGRTLAQERWVYGENGEGRKLMKACERLARARKASAIGVSVQIHKRGEAVAKLYERAGYERREISLAKGL